LLALAYILQFIRYKGDKKMEEKTKNQKGEKKMKCLGQVNQGRWCQESYESASGDARRRAIQLRKLGYQVTVGSMGMQITKVGSIRLTMVTVNPGVNSNTSGLPEVEMVW
jgi:hypothetical protein